MQAFVIPEEVLYQKQDGVEKVVSYASQSLFKSQSKYPVHIIRISLLKMGNN